MLAMKASWKSTTSVTPTSTCYRDSPVWKRTFVSSKTLEPLQATAQYISRCWETASSTIDPVFRLTLAPTHWPRMCPSQVRPVTPKFYISPFTMSTPHEPSALWDVNCEQKTRQQHHGEPWTTIFKSHLRYHDNWPIWDAIWKWFSHLEWSLLEPSRSIFSVKLKARCSQFNEDDTLWCSEL